MLVSRSSSSRAWAGPAVLGQRGGHSGLVRRIAAISGSAYSTRYKTRWCSRCRTANARRAYPMVTPRRRCQPGPGRPVICSGAMNPVSRPSCRSWSRGCVQCLGDAKSMISGHPGQDDIGGLRSRWTIPPRGMTVSASASPVEAYSIRLQAAVVSMYSASDGRRVFGAMNGSCDRYLPSMTRTGTDP